MLDETPKPSKFKKHFNHPFDPNRMELQLEEIVKLSSILFPSKFKKLQRIPKISLNLPRQLLVDGSLMEILHESVIFLSYYLSPSRRRNKASLRSQATRSGELFGMRRNERRKQASSCGTGNKQSGGVNGRAIKRGEGGENRFLISGPPGEWAGR